MCTRGSPSSARGDAIDRERVQRRTARLAMLPGLWLILSALLLVGLPGLVFYVGVVLGSLS